MNDDDLHKLKEVGSRLAFGSGQVLTERGTTEFRVHIGGESRYCAP